MRVARLRDRGARADDDERGDRHVDEERPAPARTVDEPAADERSDRAGDAAEARPRADGLGAIVLAEAGLEDRKASRRQQRAADTLQHPRGDEHLDVRRGAASSDAAANQTVPIRKTLRRP